MTSFEAFATLVKFAVVFPPVIASKGSLARSRLVVGTQGDSFAIVRVDTVVVLLAEVLAHTRHRRGFLLLGGPLV